MVLQMNIVRIGRTMRVQAVLGIMIAACVWFGGYSVSHAEEVLSVDGTRDRAIDRWWEDSIKKAPAPPEALEHLSMKQIEDLFWLLRVDYWNHYGDSGVGTRFSVVAEQLEVNA